MAVTYQAGLQRPRAVFLADDLYVDLSADDPAAIAGITVTPKDGSAQAVEDDTIRQDIAAAQSFAPPTREL